MQKNQAPNRANKSLLIGLGILITVIASAMIYLCLMKAPSAHAADYPIQGFDDRTIRKRFSGSRFRLKNTILFI